MKLRQAVTGLAAFACMTAAHAQSAGSIYLSTGWFHFAPQSSSDPLTLTTPLGSATVPNTGASISDADTIGFSVGYFVTDHIATQFDIGVPPTFNITGSGQLGAFGQLGQAKQWSPALLLKYYFNAPQSKFRPYLGVGVSRIWFTDAKITNGVFEQAVFNGGPTTVSADSSWAPVFNGGFSYAFTDHWFAGVSISYLPFSTTAKISSPFVQAQTKVKINPIVTYVNLGYRF